MSNAKEKKLTPKQECFCNFYIETGKASEAYRRAYDAEKMKPESIRRKAVELLTNDDVKLRVNELKEELKKKSDIKKEQILFELRSILDAKITDYLDFNGKTITFKNFSQLTESQIKAIESLKDGKNGIELKLHNKTFAIDRICKMLGFDEPEKVDLMVGKTIKFKFGK